VSGSDNIPEQTKLAVINPDNDVYVSSVSLWEIAIKNRLGKLDLGDVETGELIGLSEKMGFELIGLTPTEAITYGNLEENSHFDPFDRMLIWQAIGRKLTMVSKDSNFGKFIPHGLKLLWK
jgi:PIN domain nuclease of toxin-antitoxin system